LNALARLRLVRPFESFARADQHVLLDGQSGHGAVDVSGRATFTIAWVSPASRKLVGPGNGDVDWIILADDFGAGAWAELSCVALG
jgi:hypothetical protein